MKLGELFARLYYSWIRFWSIIKPVAVKWKHLHPDSKKPVRAYPADAAFDLHAVEDIHFPVGSHLNVGCGIAVQIPKHWSYDIRGRSSLNKVGMIAALGLVDADYCNELRVVLSNLSGAEYTIKKGERIGQIKFNPVWDFPWENVEEFEHKEGTRGMSGWGSSGR